MRIHHEGREVHEGKRERAFRFILFLLFTSCFLCASWLHGQASGKEPDYSLPDPDLKLVLLDSDPTESFLSVRCDSAGRLFVGGREALFVYEPTNTGGYGPRQELFRFPNHSWIYDVEVRGNDLYVLTNTALYLIAGGVKKRHSLAAKRLVWGIPMGHWHQCLHGLAWGPHGDLYVSTGDPKPAYGDLDRPDRWAYWTYFSQPTGNRTPYHGVGGVFRCRPDGSGFEVIAGGLRNSCGLAFDSAWNLFTNDNDHESMPVAYVPARLLHVTPQADFSWPRGWMLEKQPDRADLLETVFAGMGRGVPVGMDYYDDPFLPAKYRNNLLVARWGIRSVTRYPLEHHGATFRAQEESLLVGRNTARPVGVCVGRGGRVFVTISYMAHNEGSPTYRSDLVMITRKDDPETHPFQPYDAISVSAERLWAELSHPAWSRRYRAHVELRRRGGTVLDEATERLSSVTSDDPAVASLVWLGAASCSIRAGEILTRLSADESGALRHQVIRALAEFPELGAPRELFVKALSDPNLQVRHAAVVSFFELDGPLPEAISTSSARSEDTYLRQAATRLLARKAALEDLERLLGSVDTAARLAGVLAAGARLTTPPTTHALADDLPLTPYAKTAYLIDYADSSEDLRQFGRVGTYALAEHWNSRQRTEPEERLFELLTEMLDDPDESVRLQSAHFLALLNDSRSNPSVAKVQKAIEDQRLLKAQQRGVDGAWIVGPFPDDDAGFERIHPPETGPIDLEAVYRTGRGEVSWRKVTTGARFDFIQLFGKADRSAFYTYCRFKSAVRQRIHLLIGSDDGVKVWINGNPVWTNEVTRSALPIQDTAPAELQPGSNELLVRVHNVSGRSLLILQYRAAEGVAPSVPDKLGLATLAASLKSNQGDVTVGAQFLEVDWQKAPSEGDVENGRKLFQSLACAGCHAITSVEAASGGPSLAGAHRRFTVPYIVESVLFPSKQTSPIFRGTIVITTSGEAVPGLVVGETADHLELLQQDARRQIIAKAEILKREPLEKSLMPAGLVKTPEELRDLVAYILSEK